MSPRRGEGPRSLKEWIAGRLDLQPRNASDLAVLAETEPGPIRDSLRYGVVSADRAAAMTRLANTGSTKRSWMRLMGSPSARSGKPARPSHTTITA